MDKKKTIYAPSDSRYLTLEGLVDAVIDTTSSGDGIIYLSIDGNFHPVKSIVLDEVGDIIIYPDVMI